MNYDEFYNKMGNIWYKFGLPLFLICIFSIIATKLQIEFSESFHMDWYWDWNLFLTWCFRLFFGVSISFSLGFWVATYKIPTAFDELVDKGIINVITPNEINNLKTEIEEKSKLIVEQKKQIEEFHKRIEKYESHNIY